MIDTMEMMRRFKSPGNGHRPIAFWVWNDDLTPERARGQLRELASHGFGGAFAHPRPGLTIEYLSDEWFELWSAALDEAERLGLQLSIYDENSYPSGFAGGHVPSELPDCLANCVHFKTYGREQLAELGRHQSLMLNVPGHPIRAFAVKPDKNKGWVITRDVTLLPAAEWEQYGESFWLFELGTPETNGWMGGFAYADLLRPEVTQRFLEITHEEYRKRYGDRFGSVIPALFTDEPEISPGNLFQDGATFLPFTYWFAGEFEKRNGYSLFDYLPCLFEEIEYPAKPKDARLVRYDYYCTLQALWTDNSVRPISEWCEQNGLAYTGHYVEHNWPHPFNRSSPSVMSMYEYMHWPAIDMLRSEMHRPDRKSPDNSAHMLVCIREAQSAANQFDRERVLCEAFGAGGWDSSFEDYRRIGDWLFANGINALTPHFTQSSIAGARKRDHPQSFDWRQPWWEEWKTLADYFARLSAALTEGKTRNRILVLNPTTSSYLFAPKDLESNEMYKLGVEKTRQLAQWLVDRGWDFDFGDETIIERHGSVEGRRFVVANRAYEAVMVPPAMLNMKRSTASLLKQFMDANGLILSYGAKPVYLDGEAWLVEPISGHAGWLRADSFDALDNGLRTRIQPLLQWGSGRVQYSRLSHLRREHEDGSVTLFFANSSMQEIQDELLLPCGRVESWNPFSGEVTAIGNAMEDADGQNHMAVPFRLPGSGSLLLRIFADAAGYGVSGSRRDESAEASLVWRKLETGPTIIVPEEDNILPLLYCDLTVGANTYAGISALQAGRLAFEHHGFPSNPWDNGIQFKRRLLDREKDFDQRSGIAVDYHFYVLPGELPERVGLVVERPELYRITVNGIPLEIRSGNCRLDEHMGRADITAFARDGDNVVRLEGRPFSIYMEVEAVYLAGAFRVMESEGRWIICRTSPIRIGSWSEQGFAFYGGAMGYSKTVNIPASADRAVIRLPVWRGSVATVHVNGVTAGLIGLDQSLELDISDWVVKGVDNKIQVRLSGGFRNLLGPHFDPSKPRNVAWPSFWKRTPAYGPPPADEYDLIDYGLMTDFEVEVGSKETSDR
ncbi:glycosyl hydrolase [Paenibacillus glycanilyticus]|uniref:glycosyl hydrolase n=1 Tax=Paenibacillus glycanilyticus TaxID=126569 RepID=UPI001910A6C8|nr:glycosyl hydrolase [Paenibacillus glycanilyticus]